MTKQIREITHFVHKELFLSINILILVVLTALYPDKTKYFGSYIDLNTIEVLLAFMLIVTGIELSGFFELLAGKISSIGSRRKLAVTLISLSAILAAFLTNDISLFIIIPITMPFKKHFGKKFIWLLILETVAVNIGSSLTPMGNPQNIYLWQHFDVNFWKFIHTMLPLSLFAFMLLITAAFFIFRQVEVGEVKTVFKSNFRKKEFTIFSLLFIINIWLIEQNKAQEAVTADLIVILLTNRKIFTKIDWNLLLIFALLFINVKLLAEIPAVQNFFKTHSNGSTAIFLSTFTLSQVISNVPATFFMSNITDNWAAVAYGANVAGSGFIIGSLANLISMRLSKEKEFFWAYHKFALPFTTVVVVYCIIVFNFFSQ